MPAMDSESMKEKEANSSARRASNMSVEEPTSPDSNNSDSDDGAGSSREEYESYFPDNRLRPVLSRTSSTNAAGNVAPTLERTFTGKSTATTSDPVFEVDFEDDERGNPQNWPLWYKGIVLFTMSYGTTCVVLFSTSYTSAIPGMQKQFGISDSEGILGVTTYLIGMATGSVILAPLSEMYGRRPIYIVALGLFLLFVLPCALAENIETILVTRFFGAFCAAALISNAPGSINDIVDEEHRALAFSLWSIGPMNGPVIGEQQSEPCN